MKRILLACLAAILLSAVAFADVPAASRKILAPVPPSDPAASGAAARPQGTSAKKIAKRKALKPASVLLKARGVIVGIRAGAGAKSLSERILIAVGKNVIAMNIDARTILKDAKGRSIAFSRLRKGEMVKVTYRRSGARDRASSIILAS